MNRATTQVGSVELEGLGALLECRHENPFALLGPHIVEHQGVRNLRVRAYLPDMHAAWLCPDQVGESTPMRRVHPAGLFEAEHPRLVADPTAYKIRFESRGGAIRSMRDPYAFPAFLSEFDLYLFGEGKHWLCYEKLGAHLRTIGNTTGVNFAVWAPNASGVSVVGDFNGWDGRRHPMRKHIPSGVWELFIPEIQTGEKYKYRLQHDGIATDRSDPYGFAAELPPRTASIVSSLDQYAWNDQTWLEQRQATNALERPISIYEVHLGSWRRKNDAGKQDTDWLDYRELAKQLVAYCQELNYTHIELLPVSEHPFTGSWGYQTVGYFAATSRYGRPEDLMYFVDYCHQHGIGVILDWVPAHYPRDGHGLYRFDGTALYEHADPRQGEHPDWGTTIFNYGRNEVRNFLLSNALFWLDKYHIDGLRVDAVASMLYLDYSRKEGEWIPNRFGGRENLEAISLLKEFNEITHAKFPGILTIAEESTAWGGVSRPTASGGLGFSLKWNMGWMNDTLRFMAEDPIHRRYHHNELMFSMIYAFSENFCLPLSHDEVVHGKRAMLDQMPGDLWQKFANLRLLYSYMWMHPGKKLLFMGNELAQWNEWNHDGTLQWGLLEWETHRGIQRLVGDLNRFYREQPALFEIDFDSAGFEWIDCQSANESLLGFLRKAKDSSNQLLVYCNFTPVVRQHHRVGVPQSGWYQELFNSDSAHYGGSNVGNFPGVEAEPCDSHGRPWSISVTVPPLGVVVFRVPRANSASNGG